MKEIKDMTINELLADLSSSSPAPGGGSVAALTGAMAASLIEFVCEVTINKKAYKEVRGEMLAVMLAASEIRQRLVDLAEKDKQAFLQVVIERYSAESLERAAVPPKEVLILAVQLEDLAQIAIEKGNKNANTDAMLALSLARVSREGAQLNVDVNL